MFGFRNPGLMRIPLEHALKGSESDCRNRKLHQMFRLINVGEQAGSGIPKILSGWQSQHWVPPYLHEKRQPNNQTLLEMTMVDLFPSDTMQQLTQQFGLSFTELTQNERAALAIAKLEGTVTHARLQTVVTGHSVDITRDLQHLVKLGFLNSSGGRGSVYTLAGVDIVQPDDIFNEPSTEINELSLGLNEASLGPNEASLGPKESSSIPNGSYRDEVGRLCSERLAFPIIDNLMELTADFRESLYVLAHEARTKQRLSLEIMEQIILKLCSEHFFTISALGELLNRKAEPLRKRYLSPMVKANKLCLAFPTTPTHEKQAYRTNTELNHTEN